MNTFFADYATIPLLSSLESATEPLIFRLPTIQKYVQLAKQKCADRTDELTCDQAASIMLCAMQWKPLDQCLSHVLNVTLRSLDEESLKPWFQYLKLLFASLSRLPSQSQTIYRAIQFDLSHQYPQGRTILWCDFVLCLTSIERFYSEKFLNKKKQHTIITIDSHSNKNISKYLFYPNMEIILLLPGTQFQILRNIKQKNKVSWIQLKEIQSINPIISRESQIIQTSSSLERTISKYSSHSSIQIKHDQITNNDMKLIVKQAINEKQCTELWLNNCQLTCQCALILSNGLFSNSTLQKLYLNDNYISDRGVHSLCRVLAINNRTLKELYLARNGITSKGAEYLAEMLATNRTLSTLCLYGNRIADDGIQYLTHVLTYSNTTLEYLYLSGNNLITDLSIDYFLKMFEYNQTLRKLHLFNCQFSDQGKKRLENRIERQDFILLYT